MESGVTSESIHHFHGWAKPCAFHWLNRRGGKKSGFTREAFARALERLGIARPVISETTAQGICMRNLLDAQANTTEEPDAGKSQVRVRVGSFRQPGFLP
jgi:hypothetical protein